MHTSGYRMANCHWRETEADVESQLIHKNSAPLSMCNQVNLVLRDGHVNVVLNTHAPVTEYH
jgi:hypothetical protein